MSVTAMKLVLLVICFIFAKQTTYTWSGGPFGGFWSNSTNWNPNGVPTTGDSVIINTGGGAGFSSKYDLNNVQIASITVTASHTLTLNNPFTFQASATLNINPGGGNTFQINLGGNTFILPSTANTQQTSGTFSIQGGSGSFTLDGSYTLIGGSTLDLSSNGIMNCVMLQDGGSTLNLNGQITVNGAWNQTSGQITGGGTVTFTNALNLNGGSWTGSVVGTFLNTSSLSIIPAYSLTASKIILQTSVQGTGSLNLNSDITFSGSNSLTFYPSLIFNGGNIQFLQSVIFPQSVSLTGGITMTISAGMTVTFQSISLIEITTGSALLGTGNILVPLSGTLYFTTRTSIAVVPYNINIIGFGSFQQGGGNTNSFLLTGSCVFSGEVNTVPVVAFSNSLTATGILKVNSPNGYINSITINSGATMTVPTQLLLSGLLRLQGSLLVQAALSITTDILGTGTIIVSGSGLIVPQISPTVIQITITPSLTLSSSLTLTSGTLALNGPTTFAAGSQVTILTGATLQIGNTLSCYVPISGYGLLLVSNSGSITLNSDLVNISPSVNILGTVNILSRVTFSNTALFASSSVLNLSPSTSIVQFLKPSTIGSTSILGLGVIIIPSGSSLVFNSPLFTNVGFNVQGSLNFTGFTTVNQSLSIYGSLKPGMLFVNGDFNAPSGTTIQVPVSGIQTGEFDSINVQGKTTLYSNIVVGLINGYFPSTSQSFIFLNTTKSGEMSPRFSIQSPFNGIQSSVSSSQINITISSSFKNSLSIVMVIICLFFYF